MCTFLSADHILWAILWLLLSFSSTLNDTIYFSTNACLEPLDFVFFILFLNSMMVIQPLLLSGVDSQLSDLLYGRDISLSKSMA
jgi:hypothetical protein